MESGSDEMERGRGKKARGELGGLMGMDKTNEERVYKWSQGAIKWRGKR